VSRRGLLGLAALALAAFWLATLPAPVSRIPASGARASASTGRQPSGVEPVLDPEAIRDVFRFVERPATVASPVESTPAPAAVSDLEPEPFRLVGLVRRQGRLLAAFAVDGNVVLAGPGEAAGDVTVLEVGEEAVRLRHSDGSEERLALP